MNISTRRRPALGVCLLLCALIAATGRLEASGPAEPRVALIVCPDLTYRSPLVASLARSSAVALLSPGEPRKPDPIANLYATLYAGDTANTKNPRRNLLLRIIDQPQYRGRVMVRTIRDPVSVERAVQSAGAHGIEAVVCGLPPLEAGSREWDRLSVLIVARPGETPPASSLTSATTQTPGLAALRDVAPTVLAGAGIPVPDIMAGHPVHPARVAPSTLASMDTLAYLNQVILLPCSWVYGFIAGSALLTTLWTLSKGIVWRPRLQRYLLRVMMAAPLALMLSAMANIPAAWSYGAAIVLLGAVLGLIPRDDLLLGLTAAAITVDGLLGSPAVARSALSGYWISGIRFYGIGNEYMGILIGSALAAAAGAARHGGDSLRTPAGGALLAACCILILFVLSYPAFGAKAGGAVTAMTAFVPAWRWLVLRRPVTVRVCAASAIAGFAVVFLWATIASATGARETHIQAATDHAAHGDLGYIAHIAVRKAKLAVATATVPGVIVTYVGFIPIWLLWRKTSLKTRIRAFLAREVVFGGIMRAAVAASVAALLFNDSGFVAFIFLFGAPCFTLLSEMLGHTDAACETLTEASSLPAG